MNYFDSPTQRRFGEGTKALIITIAVVIFAIVLTITRWAVNYMFDRAHYLRDSIRSGMKWVVIGAIIFMFIILLILAIINILGKWQVEKEHNNSVERNTY